MQSGPTNPRESFVIPSLDGLRAISFMIVFLSHAGVQSIPGGFGVTVFFFLSGYLIATLLRLEVQASGRVDFGRFYLRRALRILPPFYIVLAFGYALVVLRGETAALSSAAVLSQLLHYSNYWVASHGVQGVAPGTLVYWSLAVEEHFYLVFPALYSLLARSGLTSSAQRSVLWGLCLAALAWRCALVYGMGAEALRTYVTTDARADSLLFGCALAIAGNPALDLPRLPRPTLRVGIGLALGLIGLGVGFLVRDEAFRNSFRYTVQGLSLIPIFVAVIRCPDWLPFRFLNLRPVRYLGVLSYSMYLLHHVVLEALAPLGLGLLARGILALTCTFALSSLMYRVVEQPCARIRKRLAARPAPVLPGPSVAV